MQKTNLKITPPKEPVYILKELKEMYITRYHIEANSELSTTVFSLEEALDAQIAFEVEGKASKRTYERLSVAGLLYCKTRTMEQVLDLLPVEIKDLVLLHSMVHHSPGTIKQIEDARKKHPEYFKIAS